MATYKKTIPIRTISAELNALTDAIQAMALPGGFKQFLAYVLSEAFANIKEHSGASKVNLALAAKGGRCSLTVADNGIGLLNSYLNKGIRPKDDFSAIEFALNGLSTKNPAERGFGLYSIRQLTGALGGSMKIMTGRGEAKIQKNAIAFKLLPKGTKGLVVTIISPIKDVDIYKTLR